ncbi:hypothetical protein BDR26DRAFT_933201 [Obelidium mucronatum]|nr:hypothetical protein BDR26DRAFT_933201 [Obelidium mucronatum]
MSFSWDAIEQRTRLKQESDRALKDYLLQQQADTKNRKLAEKHNDMAEYQRNTAGYIGTNLMNRSTNAVSFADPRSFYPPPPQPTSAIQPYGKQQQPLAIAPAAGARYNPSPPPQLFGSVNPKEYNLPTTNSITELSSYNNNLEARSIISEDVITKLRFTEEQLQGERRSRTWLETELQVSKSALATLTAKVEKLTDQLSADSQQIKELSRQAAEADRKATVLTQDLSTRFEKTQLKLQTTISDLIARQKNSEYNDTQESERQRALTDEINSLRYKLESFSLLTTEVNNEVRAKARDLEHIDQRGADTLRVIKDHDHILNTLHHNIDANTDSISKKLEMSLLDIRQRVDGESRARFQFENGMRELFNDVKKVVGNQDREINDRIEGARQAAAVAFDRERMERERGLALVLDQVHATDKGVKEMVSASMDKMGSQVGMMEDHVMQERMARAKFENVVKSDMEEGFKLIQHAVLKKFEELQLLQAEVRHSVGNAVKALKESVVLVERTTDQKVGAVEEVLRAEIRSRMETDRVLTDVKQEMETSNQAIERRAMTAISQAIEESRESSLKLEQDLKLTAETLIAAKTRSIDDLENQMELLRKRLIESDAETTSKIRMAHLAAEQVARTAQSSLEVFETRVESKFSLERQNLDEIHGKIKLIQDQSEYLKSELEDKINFRSLQIESTMSAFKEELELRVSKTDVADLETKIESSLSAMKTNLSAMSASIQKSRDEIEVKPSRKDLEDTETRLKAHFSILSSRIGEIDDSLLQIKDDLSNKLYKKDLEDHETNLKTAILNLELKALTANDLLESLKLEMIEKPNKKSLQDLDDRFKNYTMELDTKGMELEEGFRSVKDSLQQRVTKQEVEDMEKKLSDLVFGVQDRLGEISASVAEAKTEISQTMHDDVEEMVASINGALDSVQARADKIDNSVEGMKLRISESENSNRSRIQLFTTTVETMISENSISIGKTRDQLQQQIKDATEKLDALPKQIHATEVLVDDFKKKVMEVSRVEAERVNAAVSDLKEALASKVSEATLEQLQGDVTKQLQRLNAQQEIELMSIESMKLKVSDAEAFSRDSMREFRASLEKSADEQANAIRSWRDTYSKRFEELDGRTIMIPKMLDQTWAELRKVRFDIDERIRNELAHMEKDLNATKGEVATKVSSKSLDAAVSITVGPFNSRLDRLNHDIDELRSLTAKLQGEISGKLYGGYGEYSGNMSSVNYHKPMLFSPQREGQRSPAADPNLERIVDLVERKDNRPSSAAEKEEF